VVGRHDGQEREAPGPLEAQIWEARPGPTGRARVDLQIPPAFRCFIRTLGRRNRNCESFYFRRQLCPRKLVTSVTPASSAPSRQPAWRFPGKRSGGAGGSDRRGHRGFRLLKKSSIGAGRCCILPLSKIHLPPLTFSPKILFVLDHVACGKGYVPSLDL
jgi:hypothetical protein